MAEIKDGYSMWKTNILSLILPCLFISCASDLLKKEDYSRSVGFWRSGDAESALNSFPDGERKSFITSLEKAFLNLMKGHAEIDDLKRFSDIIDQRIRFSVSREVKSFFYLETPEGYFASEHEVILLHMFLSWGYSLKADYEKAAVEARRSANLLNSRFSPEGRFDDAFLRIFQAYLWAMCGNWEEARVDFKAAYNLNNSLSWAYDLSSRDAAPEEMVLVFGGAGPEPEWDPKAEWNPVRGFRNLNFQFSGKKTNLQMNDESGNSLTVQKTSDSSEWYKRHQIRDNEIQDLIKDSKYGSRVFLYTAKGSIKSVGGFIAGTSVMVLGSALGAGIIYVSAKYGSGDSAGEGIALGFIIIGASIVKGAEIISDSFKEGAGDIQEGLDNSAEYRFVRFLPEYGWVSWRYTKSGKIIIKKVGEDKEILKFSSPVGKNKNIHIGYYPDN